MMFYSLKHALSSVISLNSGAVLSTCLHLRLLLSSCRLKMLEQKFFTQTFLETWVTRSGSRAEAGTSECNVVVEKPLKHLLLERSFLIVPVVECICPCMTHLLEVADTFYYAFNVFADLSYILLNFWCYWNNLKKFKINNNNP